MLYKQFALNSHMVGTAGSDVDFAKRGQRAIMSRVTAQKDACRDTMELTVWNVRVIHVVRCYLKYHFHKSNIIQLYSF